MRKVAEHMLKGLYTATAGMITQQRRTEMLSNNMANANTPGYKADQASVRAFPEMLLNRMDNKSTSVGSFHTGVYLQELTSQNNQGELRETGLMSDVALIEHNVPLHPVTNQKGALLFAVENQAGEERYTRNGHFTLDENGTLRSNGYQVLSNTGQPITIQSSNYEISADGDIFADGEFIAQIDVRFAADIRNLANDGNGFFRTSDNTALPTALGNGAVQYSLKQNQLENSTVDVGKTYVEMMTAYRSFEANQKVLQAYDKSMDKAVNEIGRLR